VNVFFGVILKDVEKNAAEKIDFAEKQQAKRMQLRYGFIFSQYDNREITTPIYGPNESSFITISLNQWELVENMKKFFAVIAALFVASGVGQASMMIAVISISLIMQLRFRPMNEDPKTGGDEGTNALQSYLLVLEIAHLSFELLFHAGVIEEMATTAILLFITFVSFVLLLSGTVVKSLRESIEASKNKIRRHSSFKVKPVLANAQFEVGQDVLAQKADGSADDWAPGKVKQVNEDGTYDIVFMSDSNLEEPDLAVVPRAPESTDGDVLIKNIPGERIKLPDPSSNLSLSSLSSCCQMIFEGA